VAQSQSVASVDTFTWDWATSIPELLSDGESLYLIGYDTLGWQSGDDWTFVLPDALGSVRQETDATGAVTAVREWSPYGEEIDGAQAGLGYTGEWFDTGVGLQYLRARWYDGGTGRFTQQDSWEGNYNRPQSLNGWTYVTDNPLRYVDPSGYVPERPDDPDNNQFSCNCGWIDWNHVYGAYMLTRELLNNLTDAANNTYKDVYFPVEYCFYEDYYSLQNDRWAIWTWMPLDPKGIPLSTVGGFAVIPNEHLSTVEKREVLAMSIFMDLEERFEQTQGRWGIWFSRFSEEDLPSDFIGFYAGLQSHRSGTDDYEYFRQKVRKLCDAKDSETSLRVFESVNRGSWTRPIVKNFQLDWKNWGPNLVPLRSTCVAARDCGTCGECPETRKWPNEFSSLSSLRIPPSALSKYE